MPISTRYNIYGQYVGSEASRAAYRARWARWAGLYARGIGVGASRLAGVAGLVGTAGYYGYKAYKNMVLRRKRATAPRRVRRTRIAGRKRPRTSSKSTKLPIKRARVTRVKTRNYGIAKGGQLSFSRLKMGRRRRLSSRQMQRLILSYAIWRFQGVNRLNALTADTNGQFPGYFPLYYFNSNVTGTNSRLPVHIYNLTTLPSAAVGFVTNTCHELQLTNQIDSDGFYWLAQSGQNPVQEGSTAVGGTTNFWQREAIEYAANDDADKQYIRNDWFDIRLNLYGSKSQPTVYEISIISFKDDPLDVENNTNPVPQYLDRDAQAMFRSLVRPMITNPIVPGTDTGWKYVQVHKRWRYVIQPSINTDLDTNPESKVVRLFYRDGRVMNYKSRDNPPFADEEVIQSTSYIADGRGTLPEKRNEQPHYRARRYLLIRAMNTTSVAPASSNRSNTPSYDIMMRKKVVYTF